MPEWHEYPDAIRTAEALAAQVATLLAQAVATRGAAWLVVSGGNTPVPFFKRLKYTLPPDMSSRLTLTLADERCVPNTHPDSNEKLVREYLLSPEMTFSPLNCKIA